MMCFIRLVKYTLLLLSSPLQVQSALDYPPNVRQILSHAYGSSLLRYRDLKDILKMRNLKRMEFFFKKYYNDQPVLNIILQKFEEDDQLDKFVGLFSLLTSQKKSIAYDLIPSSMRAKLGKAARQYRNVDEIPKLSNDFILKKIQDYKEHPLGFPISPKRLEDLDFPSP